MLMWVGEAIGYTLDETSHGENLMNSFQARLKDLSKHLLGDGKQADLQSRLEMA